MHLRAVSRIQDQAGRKREASEVDEDQALAKEEPAEDPEVKYLKNRVREEEHQPIVNILRGIRYWVAYDIQRDLI